MKSWTLWSTHGRQRYLQNKAFHYDEAPQLCHHELKPADNNWRPFSSQGGDVISTILRREFTYDQKQGTCAEVRGHQSVFFSLFRYINIYALYWLSIFVTLVFWCCQCQLHSRLRLCPGRGGLWWPRYGFHSQTAHAMLVHSYYITLISTSGTLSFRQKNWQMCSVL